jgi:hypothetical protein
MSSLSSDSKKVNHRISCPYCKETFLIKTYSKHLIKEHKIEIFKKNNLTNLKQQTNTKYVAPIPIIHKQLKDDDKEESFVCCCKIFYTKYDMAIKHLRKSPQCKASYIESSKALYNEIVPPIEINNLVDISGNHNIATTNNIVVNNGSTLIMDNSGIVVDLIALIKKLNQVIDSKSYDIAYANKVVKKFRNKLEKVEEETDSDVSDVNSVYSGVNDDNIDKNTSLKTFDIAKRLPKFVKPITGINLSREGLKLKTAQDKADEIKQEKAQKEYEEKERMEEEQYQINARKIHIKERIAKSKDMINRWMEAIDDMKKNCDMGKECNKLEVYKMTLECSKWNKEIEELQSAENC